MQRWAEALKRFGEVDDSLVYPKPFNLMARLVDAHAKAVSKAVERGHTRPVILVGVGMGGRVALHMLSGVAGDDGKPLGAVSDDLKACVKACVLIDYPLLRVGSREVRSAPLLAIDRQPLLFVRGPGDKHMDATKLPLKRMKTRALEYVVEGKSEVASDADMAAVVECIIDMCA